MKRTLFTSMVQRPVVGLLFLGLTISCFGEPEGRRPNLLFILTDQHRQDGVGAYGRAPVQTPHLDRAAEEGVRFNRCYTAQPVCAPNRASILSGLYPHTHGLLENTWPLSSRVRTLAEILTERGYAAGYFGKWHLGRGDSQGFEVFPDYPADGRGSGHYFEMEGRRRYATEVITEDALEFMKKESDGPFFLFVSYYPPHPPYSVPARYEAMYKGVFPDDDARRKYYAMCSQVDEQIGRLTSALKRLRLDRRTLTVFTSEHGHYFEDERRWNDHAKRLCYDTASVVPLIMRFPNRIPAGQVADDLIGSVDLTPSLLGLLGAKSEQDFQGQDLSGLALGKERGREAVFMENFPFINKGKTPGRYNNEPVWEEEERAVVHRDGWKLILSTRRAPELYHLAEDSGERKNLWPRRKGSRRVETLARLLHGWAVDTGDALAPRLIRQAGVALR